MKRENLASGFSLLETILALSVLGMFLVTFIGLAIHVRDGALSDLQRSHGLLSVVEGLEGARFIRDTNFLMLADGEHGLVLQNDEWEFSGTEDIVNGYERKIVIETIAADTKKITATVEWPQKIGTASISLSTIFTNWRSATST